MRKFIPLALSCLLLGIFLFLAPFSHPASAQLDEVTKLSNCVVTRVGNPPGEPELPPGCVVNNSAPLSGIILPPNLGACVPVPAENSGGVPGEYCKMPPSLNGAYTVGNTWGSKEMVGVLFTVAQNWKTRYPAGQLRIMDISAHHGSVSEHDWGVAVDINATTNKADCVADMQHPSGRICTYGPYNRGATIELAKLLVDTGYYDVTWFNDPIVQVAVFAYAKSIDPKKFTLNIGGRTGMRYVDGHYHHFHFDADRTGKHNTSHTSNFFYSKLKRCQTVSPRVC